MAQQNTCDFFSWLFYNGISRVVQKLCIFLYVSSYSNKGNHTFLSSSHILSFVYFRAMIITFKFCIKVK